MTLSPRLHSLPLIVLFLAGCDASSSRAAEEGETSESAATGMAARTFTFDVVKDRDAYDDVIHRAALGDEIVFVGPEGWNLDEALGVPGADLPVSQKSSAGETTYTWRLSKDEPELYLRSGRFLFRKHVGSTSYESSDFSFEVSDPAWKVFEAPLTMFGPKDVVSTPEDLGVLPPGQGVIVSGPLHGDKAFGATFDALKGHPSRVTRVGREGRWVYPPSSPGKYEIDIEQFAEGYGRRRTHLSFEIQD